MTVTDPEATLAAAVERELPAPVASGGVLVARALLGASAGVALCLVLGWLGNPGNYAGARADAADAAGAAAERALDASAPFLEALSVQLVWLGLGLALLLAPAVLGLLLLARARDRARRGERVLLPLAAGLLVALACGAGIAHRYPGLFLSLLASGPLLAACARWGHLLALGVAGAVALGYLRLGWASRRWSVRAACTAVLLLPGLGAFAAQRLPGPVRVFRNARFMPPPARGSSGPNLLLLAVDSLRPDRIDPTHTPHLSRLLAESIYFPNTLVTQPRTAPSWAAALTSLPPLRNGIETMFPSPDASPLQNLALPAHLATLGYRTAVFSEYAGECFERLNLGFQVSAVPEVELRHIAGQVLLGRLPLLLGAASLLYTAGPRGRSVLGERITNLIRGLPSFAAPRVLQDDMLSLARIDRAIARGSAPGPFFWLAFYSQPHFPYTSSSDFYPRYEVPGSDPRLRFGRDALSDLPLDRPEDRQQLLASYRAALAETDAAIGDLLEQLATRRLLDSTIIVLLADHGEGLHDCPTCVGHGDNLDSMVTLRVPLAFHLPHARYPRALPAGIETYVSQLDLYPTLLNLLGQPTQAHHEGRPLLDPNGTPTPQSPRDFFAESGEWLWPTPALPSDRLHYPPITTLAKIDKGRISIDPKYDPEIRAAKHRAVLRPPYKLRYEPGAQQVHHHLYQFEEDPLETRDLATEQPGLLEDLKRSLSRSMLRHPQILPMGDYFLSRPEPPPPERY